jgi:hypothetical protein
MDPTPELDDLDAAMAEMTATGPTAAETAARTHLAQLITAIKKDENTDRGSVPPRQTPPPVAPLMRGQFDIFNPAKVNN